MIKSESFNQSVLKILLVKMCFITHLKVSSMIKSELTEEFQSVVTILLLKVCYNSS